LGDTRPFESPGETVDQWSDEYLRANI